MAPDRRLLDERQIELARHLCRESIIYLERQLGQSTLRPPTGKALLRRLTALRAHLDQLEQVLAAASHPSHPEDPTASD